MKTMRRYSFVKKRHAQVAEPFVFGAAVCFACEMEGHFPTFTYFTYAKASHASTA
jgi:hypothetical protein